MAGQENQQYTVLYGRLSQEDERAGESNSIQHQIDICKGGFTMKKIGLGIAILLFAIIISLCSSGMGLLVIGIGIVGLIFSIIGFMERK